MVSREALEGRRSGSISSNSSGSSVLEKDSLVYPVLKGGGILLCAVVVVKEMIILMPERRRHLEVGVEEEVEEAEGEGGEASDLFLIGR